MKVEATTWRGEEFLVDVPDGAKPKRGTLYYEEMRRVGYLPRPQEWWMIVRHLHQQAGNPEDAYSQGVIAALESLLAWAERSAKQRMEGQKVIEVLGAIQRESVEHSPAR